VVSLLQGLIASCCTMHGF